MKANGKMTFKKDKEKKCGMMVLVMKENISRAEKKDSEFTCGMMDLNTLVCGKRIRLKAWAHIIG